MLEVITRTAAKEQGLKRYYSGVPCAAGHDAERRVSNGHCVPCAQAKTKAWTETNPERQRQHLRAYADRNPDAGAIKYAKRSVTEKARAKTWAKNNPVKRREHRRRWEQKNPEYRRAACAGRRAARVRATPPWLTSKQRQEILAIYRSCPKDWNVDHIIPLQGENVCGLHVPWNLQHLPAPVNAAKGNRIPV